MRRLILLTITGLVIGGCSFAPEYVQPQVPLPEQWSDPSLDDNENRAEQWWQRFGDPALAILVQESLDANLDLQIAAARVAEARAFLSGREAERYPMLSIEGSGARQGPSEEAAGFGPNQARPFTDFRVSGLLTYEFDLWGRKANASEAAQHRLLASAANQEMVRLAIISEVASGYINLLALNHQITIAENTVATRRESVQLQRTRFQGGDIDELALRQAEAELAATQAELPALRLRQTFQIHAIGVLLGKPPRDIKQETLTTHSSIESLEAPATFPAGPPAALIVRRPDIKAAEQLLKAANAEIGVARAAYLPTISFAGLIGLQSAQVGDLFSSNAANWQLGGSLLSPLVDFGRTEALIAQAESRQTQAYLSYGRVVQQAFREVWDALEQVQRTDERLESKHSQVTALKQSTRLASERFKGGYSSYLEVLDSERNLFNAELALVEIKRDRLLADISLFRALGGDY
jgi:multidrug efflux system outer membrane protein